MDRKQCKQPKITGKQSNVRFGFKLLAFAVDKDCSAIWAFYSFHPRWLLGFNLLAFCLFVECV